MELLPNGLPVFGALMTWLHPLWMVAAGMAIAVAALFLVFLLLRLAIPKTAAVAWTTAKEGMSQPLFYVILAIGVFALLSFPFIPYNTFGDDVKMVKDQGLTLIMILSILLALWTASESISQEIEGRTALTVLSKPISRRSFIIGKFLGIIGPIVILFIILGALFLATVSYKVVYDARESCLPEPTAQDCLNSMVQILPGLALAFLEAVVLTSISVAISTRLPIMPNLIICASIYVLGHLVPILLKSAEGAYGIVHFVAGIFTTILPVLDHFNIYPAIATGSEVSWQYVGLAALYCALFSSVAMLVALLLFEDRDLA